MVLFHSTAATEEGDHKHNQAHNDQDHRCRCIEALISEVHIRVRIDLRLSTHYQDYQSCYLGLKEHVINTFVYRQGQIHGGSLKISWKGYVTTVVVGMFFVHSLDFILATPIVVGMCLILL